MKGGGIMRLSGSCDKPRKPCYAAKVLRRFSILLALVAALSQAAVPLMAATMPVSGSANAAAKCCNHDHDSAATDTGEHCSSTQADCGSCCHGSWACGHLCGAMVLPMHAARPMTSFAPQHWLAMGITPRPDTPLDPHLRPPILPS